MRELEAFRNHHIIISDQKEAPGQTIDFETDLRSGFEHEIETTIFDTTFIFTTGMPRDFSTLPRDFLTYSLGELRI